jgi:hypothetical protein
MKASKNRNNVISEECLALIRTIVIYLGDKLTYGFLYATTKLLQQMYVVIFCVLALFYCWWLYFIVSGFNKTIRVVNVFFCCLWWFWCLCLACRTWSGHESTGPLGAWVDTKVLDPLRSCVKTADYCDPSSAGILTYVKIIEMCVESIFVIVCVRFTIADYFFYFGENG